MSVERTINIDMSRHTASQALKMIYTATLAIQGNAKLRAPVDTGNLRGSISHRFPDAATGEVFANVEYAAFQEYGTRKMKAQPYMRPAFDEVAQRIGALWGGR